MTPDLFAYIAQATIGLSVATISLLMVRRYIREAFGARIAYAAWLVVPVAAIASMLPAEFIFVDEVAVTAPAPASGIERSFQEGTAITLPEAVNAGLDHSIQGSLTLGGTGTWISLTWIFGSVVGLVGLVVRQRRFLGRIKLKASPAIVHKAGNNEIGPVVVGIMRPRIIVPGNFKNNYTAKERALIVAHEGAHIRAGDLYANAVAVVVKCLNWFNPLVYLAYSYFRVDQELACDERVMYRRGKDRRLYAETLLKSQLESQVVPFCCAWVPASMHPLKDRVARLGAPELGMARRGLGVVVLVGALTFTGATAWATLSSHVMIIEGEKTGVERGREYAATGPISGADEHISEAQDAALVDAIMEGRRKQARALVRAGADVNYFKQGDGTPLVVAARSGDSGLVNLLLEAGADVNKKAPGDGNPLIEAVRRGDMKVVNLLLEAGADANGYVRGDETPLIAAAMGNQLDIAKLLLDAGADANLRVETGHARPRGKFRSPLGQAVLYRHKEMANLLRRHGATPFGEEED